MLLGVGVVFGLECSVKRGRLAIQPGVAIDCLGREIVVPKPETIEIPRDAKRLQIGLHYVERKVDPVPVPGGDPEQPMEASMIEEGFQVVLGDDPMMAKHAARDGRWEACSEDHPVPLFRLRRRRGKIRIRPVRAKR